MTKVLYVEHDDDNLYMLKMRLERFGDFEILTAGDSEKGCELAVTEHQDVILMDLEMPDSDCWEVVRRLKKDAQTCHIPIIGMSAYDRYHRPPSDSLFGCCGRRSSQGPGAFAGTP